MAFSDAQLLQLRAPLTAAGWTTEDVRRFGQAGKKKLTEVKESLKSYLKRLFTDVPVNATDGKETLASSGLFTGGIYGLVLPVPSGNSTLATNSVFDEMAEDGDFATLYGSIPEGDGEWEESQMVDIVRHHKDKLTPNGWATLFRVKGGFVVDVRVRDDGRLRALVYRFSRDYLWHAKYRHRLVSPQL